MTDTHNKSEKTKDLLDFEGSAELIDELEAEALAADDGMEELAPQEDLIAPPRAQPVHRSSSSMVWGVLVLLVVAAGAVLAMNSDVLLRAFGGGAPTAAEPTPAPAETAVEETPVPAVPAEPPATAPVEVAAQPPSEGEGDFADLPQPVPPKTQTAPAEAESAPAVAEQKAEPAPSEGALTPAPSASAENLPSMPDPAAETTGDTDAAAQTAAGTGPEEQPFYEAVQLEETMGGIERPRLQLPPPEIDRAGITVEVTGASVLPTPEGEIAAASDALKSGKLDLALQMFNALVAKNSSDQRILMGRAVTLQKLGRTEEAVKAYEALLEKAPDNPDVKANMLGLIRRENPALALDELMDLRQKYPGNVNIAAQTGLAMADVGNLDEALKYLEIAAGLEPDNPKHYYNMAVIAERKKDIPRAIFAYEKALEADALADAPTLSRDRIYDRLSRLRQMR